MQSKPSTNRLILEASPYLQQHAHNPVDWFPWGEEAFIKAKTEDKPIFLSIGYSTCHWCHVFAKESFEDPEIAKILNDHYVSIKVDREERPDIDAIYMAACQMITGKGGWPLTIIMDYDQKPFFAGTYFPRQQRYHMPSIEQILLDIAHQWKNDREKLLSSKNQIYDYMLRLQSSSTKGSISQEEFVEQARDYFQMNFDVKYGGFGGAPKFPSPHNLLFLLRLAQKSGDKEAVAMVETSLLGMYQGGIFDHIGYGFSRYAIDDAWMVPHFEKMLYDNALLMIVYYEAYLFTRNDLYKKVALQTMDYVLSEMRDSAGGFYASQDADSNGQEGAFYLWEIEELYDVLGQEDAKSIIHIFDVTKHGNFHGKNILHRRVGEQMELSDDRMEAIRRKLYDFRKNRMKLHLDDKIITAWNGMMMVALLYAYRVTGEATYLQHAKDNLAFVENNLMADNRVYTAYRQGIRSRYGILDDYAYLAWALLTFYETTFDISYMKKAKQLTDHMIQVFYDDQGGGFFLNQEDNLFIRPKEFVDGAIPSGNSVAAYVLTKLDLFLGGKEYWQILDQLMETILSKGQEYPHGFSFALLSMLLQSQPQQSLIAALDRCNTDQFFKEIGNQYLPHLTIICKTRENEEDWDQLTSITDSYPIQKGKDIFYLCEQGFCRSPVFELPTLLSLL